MTSRFPSSRFRRAGTRRPSNPPPIIPTQLSEALPIFRNIPDLSSEVKLLGDVPVASGVFSSIWLGELLTGQQVAVKIMVPTRPEKDQAFFRELYVWLHAMPHEHVLPLLGLARFKDSVAFVSPYMPGRSLDVQLSECSTQDKLRIITEIANAIAFLHTRNIVYGNIRLSTVVLDQNKKAYLSSFLFSSTDWTELAQIDPELRVFLTDSRYDDVLSFGTLLALVFTNIPSPSRWRTERLVTQLLIQGQFKEALGSPDVLAPETKIWPLVKSCWEEEYAKRPAMEEVFLRTLEILQSTGPQEGTGVAYDLALKPTIKDISPEIRKLSEYPIAGGGYCDLYLGERLGKEKVALKLVRLFGPTDQDKNGARKRFLSEVQVWADLHHVRILEFYGICEYGTLSMYMVSPFLQNGNVMDYLNKTNSNANRRQLLIETAEGLVYLHNRNPPIIHGDLKGGNILISDSGTAVLADFGLSRISHEMTSSFLQGAGSPRWMAPELMRTGDDIVAGPLRTTQSDVYGYGHIMLEVLGNEKPFYNIKDDLRVLVELIHGRRPARPTGLIASQWLDDNSWAYCQRCTDADPETRPTITDVLFQLHKMYD